jgi:hypothetical protein
MSCVRRRISERIVATAVIETLREILRAPANPIVGPWAWQGGILGAALICGYGRMPILIERTVQFLDRRPSANHVWLGRIEEQPDQHRGAILNACGCLLLFEHEVPLGYTTRAWRGNDNGESMLIYECARRGRYRRFGRSIGRHAGRPSCHACRQRRSDSPTAQRRSVDRSGIGSYSIHSALDGATWCTCWRELMPPKQCSVYERVKFVGYSRFFTDCASYAHIATIT